VTLTCHKERPKVGADQNPHVFFPKMVVLAVNAGGYLAFCGFNRTNLNRPRYRALSFSHFSGTRFFKKYFSVEHLYFNQTNLYGLVNPGRLFTNEDSRNPIACSSKGWEWPHCIRLRRNIIESTVAKAVNRLGVMV
jgi:hypothetical protein